jgi:N-acetylmuramoyl-L-alanine amidase
MPPEVQNNDPFAGLDAVEVQPQQASDPFEGLEAVPVEPQEAPQQPAEVLPSPAPSQDPFEGLGALPELDEEASFLDQTLTAISESQPLQAADRGFGLLAQAILPTEPQEALVVGGRELRAAQQPRPLPPESDNPLDQTVSFLATELPLLVSGGKVAKGARSLTNAIGFTNRRIARSGALKTAERAVRGGAEFGAFSGASEALQQRVQGEFDPGEIVKTTAQGAALGALLNPAFEPLVRKVRKASNARRANQKARFKKQLDPEATAALRVSPKEIKQAKKLNRRIERLETKITQATNEAVDDSLPALQRKAAQQKAARAVQKRNRIEEDFLDVMQGDAYKTLMENKRAFGEATVKLNGKNVRLFEQALSPRGVLLSPAEIQRLGQAGEIGILDAGAYSTKDIVRLVQQSEGQLRGPLRRALVDPIDNANRVRLQQEALFRDQLKQQVAALKVSTDKATQKRLFQAAEGRLPLESLSESERQFVDFTKKSYSDLLDRINQVNATFGLPEVAKRKNYVTHLQELNALQKLGLKPGATEVIDKSFGRAKSKLAFEKARTGDRTQENLLESFEAYISPAFRRIFMTKSAAEVQARAKFLPPNLRKGVNEWVETAVLGGIDKKDETLIRNGFETPLKMLESISAVLTRGVIGGSVRVAIQQPSQIASTAILTDFRSMLKGLGQAFFNPPKAIARRSNFLTGRTIQDELIPVKNNVLKSFDKYSGFLLEKTDRYVARASWYAGFDKAKRMGLSDAAAIRYGDEIGRMLHASYQQILKPSLLRGRSGKAVLPFQTFAFNTWNLLTRDPRVLAELKNTSKLRETMQLLGAMAATNQMYSAMGLPEPMSIILPEELTPAGVLQAALESSQVIPVAGATLSPSGSLRVPSPTVETLVKGQQAFRDLLTAINSEKESTRDRAWTRFKRFGARLAPAGNQVRNFIEGAEAAKDGYYSVGDKEVDLDKLDKAISRLIGPTGTKPVREEFRRRNLEHQWHRSRGFKKIGYHYFINPSGKLETGRTLKEVGAHCKGHNAKSIGICLAGRDKFQPEQFDTLRSLLSQLNKKFPDATIHGHREFNPGKTCPVFKVKPFKKLYEKKGKSKWKPLLEFLRLCLSLSKRFWRSLDRLP